MPTYFPLPDWQARCHLRPRFHRSYQVWTHRSRKGKGRSCEQCPRCWPQSQCLGHHHSGRLHRWGRHLRGVINHIGKRSEWIVQRVVMFMWCASPSSSSSWRTACYHRTGLNCMCRCRSSGRRRPMTETVVRCRCHSIAIYFNFTLHKMISKRLPLL